MSEVGIVRLYLLRAMYLLIAVGLAMIVWPYIVLPHSLAAGPRSVVRALLGALAVMCVLGLRYPIKMLPILFVRAALEVHLGCRISHPDVAWAGLGQIRFRDVVCCPNGRGLGSNRRSMGLRHQSLCTCSGRALAHWAACASTAQRRLTTWSTGCKSRYADFAPVTSGARRLKMDHYAD